MQLLGIRDVLTAEEIQVFHKGALRIIDRVGMQVENDEMLSHLADFGGRVDMAAQRVTFAPEFVEEFLASRERHPSELPDTPEAGIGIGGYSLNYEDPETGEVRRFTTHDFVDCCRIGDALPNVAAIGHVGVPGDVPAMMLPLHLRFLLWRHVEHKMGNTYMIFSRRACPYIYEMCSIYAEMESKPLDVILRPTNFMVSPLRYPREEAEQFVWFWKKGHYFNIANMLSAGGSAPVTLPGAVCLALAESIFLNIIPAAFYGRKDLYMGSTIAPMDMRRGTYPYGRPEQSIAELAMSNLVRHYAGGIGGSSGHGDSAKGTDYEAGLTSAVGPVLGMAFNGSVGSPSGIYSVDEVFSPVKLAIDCEFLDHMKRLARPMTVTEESLALDVIEEVGPGGIFTDRMHTAEHFRDEIWLPELFSSESFESWKAGGRRTIVEKAREVVRSALAESHPRGISPETEKALLAFMEKAKADLVD